MPTIGHNIINLKLYRPMHLLHKINSKLENKTILIIIRAKSNFFSLTVIQACCKQNHFFYEKIYHRFHGFVLLPVLSILISQTETIKWILWNYFIFYKFQTEKIKIWDASYEKKVKCTKYSLI